MELSGAVADEQFRAQLQQWLSTHLPGEVREAAATRLPGNGNGNGGDAGVPPWARRWQAQLFDAGWLVPPWPPELGGRNATPAQTLVYFEELARRRVPRSMNFQGLSIVAPSLRDFGTPEQIERWLVPTLRADLLWCIGMSEPGAGSDLGGLATRATESDNGFVVNGQKVWTSSAHLADWCFLYARTDPAAPKHKGISVLAVDMRTPGIEVRPFPHLTGHVDFAEVFFTDAVVPRENLVGGLHDGWRVTMASLAHERSGLWVQGVANLESIVTGLVDLARATGRIGDPHVRRQLAWAHEQVATLRALGYKGVASFAQQLGAPEHSLLKLATAELGKVLTELGLSLHGPFAGLTDGSHDGADGSWATSFFTQFAGTIAGGTSQIQRNIIAERVLGLPRARVSVGG
ncbi:MAG: acyl-CoA dehydrogenase family protein [Mycobacteriales bacterium]